MLKKKYIFSFIILLMTAVVLFPAFVLAGTDADEIISNAPGQSDYPDASAIILKDDLVCDYSHVPYTQKVEKIYKLFNQRGIDTLGEASIRYDDNRENVEIIEAYTVKPDGSKVQVAEEEIHDITPPESAQAKIYSSVKDKVISFPALEPGSTIVYSYIIKETSPLIEDNFWQSSIFAYIEPIKETSMLIKVPENIDINYKTINGNIEPVIDKKDGYITYLWKATDVPAIKQEIAMPELVDIAPIVRVSTFGSWDEFNNWYSSLIDTQYELNDTIKQKIEELTTGLNSEDDKIRALYNYVAENIRYVGLEYGIDGYKPHGAIDVYENKYGDCKDKATLLIALLSNVGVKAEAVLINTVGHSGLDIASPGQFNHMIVYIPDKDLFLDPTSNVNLYGSIPAVDQNKKVVMPIPGKIVKTPLAPAEDNREYFEQNVKISGDGSAEIKISWTDEGVFDTIYKGLFKQYNKQQRGMLLTQIVNSFYPNAELKDYQLTGVDGLDSEFKIEMAIAMQNYTQSMGNTVSFRPFRMALNLGQIVGSNSREHPLYLGYNLNAAREMKIEIPEGYTVNYMPDNINIENSIGAFKVSFEQEEQTINVSLDLRTYKDLIGKDDYQQIRDLFNTAEGITQQQILLQKTSQ